MWWKGSWTDELVPAVLADGFLIVACRILDTCSHLIHDYFATEQSVAITLLMPGLRIGFLKATSPTLKHSRVIFAVCDCVLVGSCSG